MAEYHLARQAERKAELAHLILEQLAQRLQQLEVERFRQAAHVVVRLDGLRLLGLGARGLDDVGIDRALGEPFGIPDLAGFALEDVHKMLADDLALLLGIGDTFQGMQKLAGGVDVDHLHAHVLGKRIHHLRRFIETQEAVVNKDAGELVADRTVDERSRDGGVHAAGKTEDHLLASHLLLDLPHRLADIVGHVPVAAAAADLAHEAVQDLHTLPCVRDLGMELNRIETACLVGHGGNRTSLGRGHQPESGGQLDHLVAVAHPHFQHAVALGRAEVLDAVQELRVPACPDLGIAELAHFARLDAAAELLRHGLHAVADAEHRDAELEYSLRGAPGGLLVRRHVAAGQDDAGRAELAHERVACIAGVNLAVDLGFADAARDQLRVLGAEIEDEYFLVTTLPGNSAPP